jgi:ATP-dependent RNA helicase DeaD
VEAIRWLVLDEADEMLKMGFQEDMDAILAATPETRQTLLFSATMPQEIVGMTKRYMKSPEEISVGVKNKGATNVEHWYYVVHPKDKYLALKRIADLHPDIYGIVFCKTRMETQEIATALIEDNYNADALHGDLSQAQRDQVMARFRSGHLQLLIATDVAARGLDVEDLTHVINYRLPDHLDSYIHRSGRTGRAGKNGISISIIAPRDKRLLKTLEYQVGKQFLQKRIPGGAEIVQQQLVNYVAKIVDTQVDAERLAPLMAPVYERLSYLSREELIQKFVGMEFSRMLSYYQRANDLNADLSSGGREERGDRRGREERYDRRDDRQEGGHSRERRDRPERTAGRTERTFEERPTWERKSAKTDRLESLGRSEFVERPERSEKPEHVRLGGKGFTRYFINLGSKNELTAPKLIDMINSNDDLRSVQIGKIEILKKFSFFELDNAHLGDAASLLSGRDFDGTVTHVEPAEAPKTPALTKEKSFGFGDPKKRATGFAGRSSQGTGFAPRNSEFRKGGEGFGFNRRERKESEGGFWSKAPMGSKAGAKSDKPSSVEKASKPNRFKGSLSSLD